MQTYVNLQRFTAICGRRSLCWRCC